MAMAEEGQPLMGSGGPSIYVKQAQKADRAAFVRKVYSILSCQLLLTCAIAGPICQLGPVWAAQNQWMLFISLAGMVVTMGVMCCCSNLLRQFPYNYAILGLVTVVMSITVGFTSAQYTWQSVLLSAGVTASIFVLMTIYAWTTETDFTGMGPYLFAGLCVLMVFGFVISLMGMFGAHIEWALMLYDVGGVILFTFYIVFDTQLIMGELGGHKMSFTLDDYAFAALNLYMDIINLFLHILRLMGERR